MGVLNLIRDDTREELGRFFESGMAKGGLPERSLVTPPGTISVGDLLPGRPGGTFGNSGTTGPVALPVVPLFPKAPKTEVIIRKNAEQSPEYSLHYRRE
jgi:hypothetical protein